MAEHDNNDKPDDLAADYVLGVLNPQERAQVEQRMKTDAVFATAIAGLQTQLEPLLDKVSPVVVPKDNLEAIWNKIDSRMEPAQRAEPAETAQIVHLQRRVKRWQRVALAASAIAASLVLYIATMQFLPGTSTPPGSSFVAILQSDDKTAHFVASVDLERSRIDILRMGPGPTGDKTYELWAVGGGRAKPQSLGLVSAAGSIPVDLLKKSNAKVLQNTVLAVSLEPTGGSPTGQPTGPVLFTGKLVPFSGK